MHTTSLPTDKPESVGMSSARLQRLSEKLRSQIANGHIPGAVGLVARRDKVVWMESLGARDPAAADPMTEDAVFRIYSMTKPIVSVAIMMLWEEGKFLLHDPVAKYLPEFAAAKVLAERDGTRLHEAPARAMTVQDLLRHTSGLTYEFGGNGPVHKAYKEARIFRNNQTNAEQATMLVGLPLLHHPGTQWEYSRSTDVLGRLVEVLSGVMLGAWLRENILGPLGMQDSGFHVPEADLGRLAGGFAKDPESGADAVLLNVTRPARFESGGGGMVASTMDYARFLQMLLNGGTLNGHRLLSRKTVELMTADHLGGIPAASDILPEGYGFGLGFAVRKDAGIATMPGSVGQYYWGGAAGTTFWVDPAERLFAVLMIQAPGQREYYRVLFRDMVYAAIAD